MKKMKGKGVFENFLIDAFSFSNLIASDRKKTKARARASVFLGTLALNFYKEK